MHVSISAYRKNARIPEKLKSVGDIKRDHICNDNKRYKEGKKEGVLGPRELFKKKYKATGNVDLAKQELRDHGYRPEFYGEEALENWRKESGKEGGDR